MLRVSQASEQCQAFKLSNYALVHVLHPVDTAVLAPPPTCLSKFPEYHSKQTPDSYETHVGHDRRNVAALLGNVS